MKAVAFDVNQVAPALFHEWEKPQPDAGEVLIRLHAAALNHRDINITNPKNKVSFVYGSDGAGVVEKIGEGVTGWSPGDEVILNAMVACLTCPACLAGEHSLCENESLLGGRIWGGTFAEYIKVPARNVVPKPDHLTMTQAAALPMAFGTAWRALITQARLTPGDTVLIQGIGGGVALACLQIAVGMGARVIVTSGSADKLQKAINMGAYAGIHYKEEDVAARTKELTGGKGADVIVASTGDVLSNSIQAAAKKGRIVQFSYIGKPVESFDVDQLMFRQLALIGSAMHTHGEFEAVLRFVHEKKIVPIVSEIRPLEEFADAFASMRQASQFGKIVLTMPQT
ncbi:alcohol dehydrogenase catalytic domain-containing protein [Brevibacillus fluminis]|uniref:alcohol dehydrogenase catalytic domain-containing protein n=1 Tax=Brevibacillus fluminis TaxID=511487 RepID=UPI003F89377C